MTLDDKLREWRESTESLVPPERLMSALRQAVNARPELTGGAGGIASGTLVLASVMVVGAALSVALLSWWLQNPSAPQGSSLDPTAGDSEPRAALREKKDTGAVGAPSVPHPSSAKGTRFRVWSRGDLAKVRGLRLRGRATCVARHGLWPLAPDRSIELTTDDRGNFVVNETSECIVFLAVDDPMLALGEVDDDQVELVGPRRVVAFVSDTAGRAVSGAKIDGMSHFPSNQDESPFREPRDINLAVEDKDIVPCTTDQAGRCELAVPEGFALSLNVSAPGLATKPVSADSATEELRVTLEAERVLSVTVTSGEPALVAVLELRVEPASGPEQTRTVDAPGNFSFGGLTSEELRVSLREIDVERPLVVATVPAGSEDAEVSLAVGPPRPLDVWFSPVPDSHPRFVDIRCPGASRLLARLTRVGNAAYVRLEYTPEGPCVVALAEIGFEWSTDPSYQPVTVSPPGRADLIPATGMPTER